MTPRLKRRLFRAALWVISQWVVRTCAICGHPPPTDFLLFKAHVKQRHRVSRWLAERAAHPCGFR